MTQKIVLGAPVRAETTYTPAPGAPKAKPAKPPKPDEKKETR